MSKTPPTPKLSIKQEDKKQDSAADRASNAAKSTNADHLTPRTSTGSSTLSTNILSYHQHDKQEQQQQQQLVRHEAETRKSGISSELGDKSSLQRSQKEKDAHIKSLMDSILGTSSLDLEWPYKESTLISLINLREEQEKRKIENLKTENFSKTIELIKLAYSYGINPDLIPSLLDSKDTESIVKKILSLEESTAGTTKPQHVQSIRIRSPLQHEEKQPASPHPQHEHQQHHKKQSDTDKISSYHVHKQHASMSRFKVSIPSNSSPPQKRPLQFQHWSGPSGSPSLSKPQPHDDDNSEQDDEDSDISDAGSSLTTPTMRNSRQFKRRKNSIDGSPVNQRPIRSPKQQQKHQAQHQAQNQSSLAHRKSVSDATVLLPLAKTLPYASAIQHPQRYQRELLRSPLPSYQLPHTRVSSPERRQPPHSQLQAPPAAPMIYTQPGAAQIIYAVPEPFSHQPGNIPLAYHLQQHQMLAQQLQPPITIPGHPHIDQQPQHHFVALQMPNRLGQDYRFPPGPPPPQSAAQLAPPQMIPQPVSQQQQRLPSLGQRIAAAPMAPQPQILIPHQYQQQHYQPAQEPSTFGPQDQLGLAQPPLSHQQSPPLSNAPASPTNKGSSRSHTQKHSKTKSGVNFMITTPKNPPK